MNSFKTIVLVLTGILLTQFSLAQFSLTGEFRPRTELNRGYKSLAETNQKASVFTAQRSRLNFLFNNEFVQTKLVLQDVRTWGSMPQLVTNHDYATSLHEGWAEVILAEKYSLKAGRQELVYDDQRIFGNVGWAHQARSHDVVLLKYSGEVTVHFGFAHHENSNIINNIYDGPDGYKNLQFVWLNKKSDNHEISLLALNNGVPYFDNNEQKCRYSKTIGGRYLRFIESGNIAANFYYQTGKHPGGKEISALNFLAEVELKNGFTAGYEFLSGTDYSENEKINSFIPLYGTNHKFNGFMDYFYVGNHINSVGLNDVYLKYKFTKNKIGFNADLHYFGAAADISNEAKSYLGTELDLSAFWTVQPSSKITIGFSKMFAGRSMVILKGGNSNENHVWAYFMLSVTPTFMK